MLTAGIRVYFPPALRRLVGGADCVEVQLGAGPMTVQAVLDQLERQFPGIKSQLLESNLESATNQLRPGLAVAVNSRIWRSNLCEPIPPQAEIHFIPAIAGG